MHRDSTKVNVLKVKIFIIDFPSSKFDEYFLEIEIIILFKIIFRKTHHCQYGRGRRFEIFTFPNTYNSP